MSLEFRGIEKRFGSHQAVLPTDLMIREGELFSLLGPSGCGKTTLLRMIGGFEEPTSGELLLDGTPLTRVPPHKRPFNLVFQRYALFPHLSVLDNVAFGLRMKGTPAAEARARAGEALALVRMEAFASRSVPTLSGGQQQRVALARALVNEPRVLLLDEPLSALDLKLRQAMQVELLALHRKLAASGRRSIFIFVTHDQEEALTLSDRIAVMNHGAIEQIGTPSEIYDRPRTPFVARFIGSINAFDAVVREWESAEVAARWVGTPEGGQPWVARAADGASRVARGGTVQVLVRPEKLRISPHDRAGSEGAGASNQLEGRIRDVLFLGASTQYLVEAGEGEAALTLTVTRPSGSGESLSPGARVRVSWRPEDCLVMPGAADAQGSAVVEHEQELEAQPEAEPEAAAEEST